MSLCKHRPLCQPQSCCSVSAKLIIKDNETKGYVTLSYLNPSQPFPGAWAQSSFSGNTRSRHGAAAQKTNVEQTDRVHPGRHRLCRGSGQCLEVPLSLLQEWRRWGTSWHPQTELPDMSSWKEHWFKLSHPIQDVSSKNTRGWMVFIKVKH